MNLKTRPFNPYEILDEQEIKDCLVTAFYDDDPDVFITALRHAVKAIGVAKVANMSGLSRTSLYKSVKSESKPRWSTISSILKAFDIKLIA